MTHKELVKRAERWLLNTAGCKFVLAELTSRATETPDAIGWKEGRSILVECKTSRSDFLNDQRKLFRKNPRLGMGIFRFYLCPPGVIKPKELPEKWGLLYCHSDRVKKVVAPKKKPSAFRNPANLQAEIELLCSALRRVHVRGDLQKIYNSVLGEVNG